MHRTKCAHPPGLAFSESQSVCVPDSLEQPGEGLRASCGREGAGQPAEAGKAILRELGGSAASWSQWRKAAS